ncbi:MAG: hypothetical protein AB8F78_10230 [Saprospiraceae bacterium]
MATDTQYTSKRKFSPGLLIKLLISLALCIGLYYQLFVHNDIVELWKSLRHRIEIAPVWMPILVVTLLPFNLLLEAMKFRLLLPSSMRPTVSTALRRVCAGLSIGLFTPNRVGEYIGRLTGTTSDQRVATVAATFLGGIAQWIPLLGGGVLCAIGFNQYGDFQISSQQTNIAAAFICVGLLVFFAFLPRVVQVVERLWSSFRQNLALGPRLHRFSVQISYTLRGIRKLASERPGDVRLALLIACGRYLIYLIQLSLAFVFFGLEAGLEIAVLGSGLLLFAQTFVPLPAFIQALARVELALLLWAAYEPNELGLASASFLIFVLNLGIPALLGLVEILRSDVDKTLGINA